MRLLVQDEDGLLPHLLDGSDITLAKNSQTAIALLKEKEFDCVICEELEVLKYAKSLYPLIPVAVITPFASVDKAVEAMRLGAFNYLSKSSLPHQVTQLLEGAERELALQKEPPVQGKMEEMIVESSVMQQLLRDIVKIAKSSASVFIYGESGTGKEVVAHAIHRHSARAARPFIKVNCAAIAETLIESEFLGHEKGAFTGALERRLGRFELAHQGSLLLDEVTEIPLAMQAKLLRVVQEQEFERVGGTKPLKVDVRLIATSNRNMKEAIAQKIFREDLYYRLNVVPIELPPLRERKEDIPSLADYFLEQFCKENRKRTKKLSLAAKQKLIDYRWPGNIRELANILERTVVMDLGDWVEADHLRLETSPVMACPVIDFEERKLAEVEKQHILRTLQSHQGNKTHAAKTLGISLRTLRNKLRLYKES